MDQHILAMPFSLLAQVSLSPGATLEIVTAPDGCNRLDVTINGKIVAKFNSLEQAGGQVVSLQRLYAATAPIFHSRARRLGQWWDDDLLDEPLEPLADFE